MSFNDSFNLNANKPIRNRWRGGPPDYMWWLVTILQIVSIVLHFILAIQE